MADRGRNPPLARRIAALLVLMCVPIGLAAGLCIEIIREKQHSYALLNYAGTQRMRIERHANYINRTITSILLNDWEAAIENRQLADETAAEFEKCLAIIRNGGDGFVRQTSVPVHLPPVMDRGVLAAIDRVEEDWKHVKRGASQALRADTADLLTNPGFQSFQTHTHHAYASMDDAVYELQRVAERQLQTLSTIIALSVAATFAFLLAAIRVMRTRIVEPFEDALDAVKVSEARLLRATTGTQDGLWDWNLKTNEVWYSERYWTMLGIPEGGPFPAPQFDSFLQRVHPDDKQMIFDVTKQCLDNGTAIDQDFRVRTESGEYKWIRARAASILGDDGQPERLAGSSRDIDQLKSSEAAREDALAQLAQQTILAKRLAAQADAANIAKSAFLANMSHEIRTPLTAILGFADTLTDSGLPSEDRAAVATIQRNGAHLLSIINDILDLSKVESGKMTVEMVEVSPVGIIAEVASIVRVKSEASGIGLDVDFVGAIPKTIQSDPTRLRQILINLIGNAIKFTEAGGVRLTAQLLPDDLSPILQIDIVDTGIGMTKQQIESLFNPFSQADGSTTRRFGGTGLGLTISRRFAELLGGNVVVVESKPGVGTRFRVTVATGSLSGVEMIEKPSLALVSIDEKKTEKPLADIRGVRILLAEDGLDNQRLISHVLRKAGAQVTISANGWIAADAALAARDQGEPFDVVLMDMQMPVMDGYEATRHLRANRYDGPIIALTANAMDGDRTKCIAAGCNDYATKPIDRRELIAAIARQARAESVTT